MTSLCARKSTNVLVQSSDGTSSSCSENDTMYSWNDGFTSSKGRIRFPVMIRSETNEERAKTERIMQRERNPEIEAAIVRVMKSRKKMHFTELIEETAKQLQHRFMPHPQDVKKRVEVLVEREFIARDPNDRQMYHYAA